MKQSMFLAIALAVFTFAGLAEDVNAQFPQLIPTKIGLVKFGGTPAIGKLYKIVSKAPNPPVFALPSADPAVTGGSLTVTIGAGTLSCTFAAQPFVAGGEGWKTLGPPATPKGYKYINTLAPAGIAGPCKIVIVKQKVIKTIVKGTGTLPVPLAPGANPDVSTVLDLGGDKYCAYAVAPHFKEKADRLIKAKNQSPPAACPGGPTTTLPGTTTTTMGSTTTTTGATTTTTTLPPPQDHFKVYEIGLAAPMMPVPVHLEDQFHPGPVGEDVLLEELWLFMPPVVKTPPGIPLVNPGNHLTCYRLFGTFGPASVSVDNQFGDQELTVYEPAALCTPSDKLLPDDGLVPAPSDHYKCYWAEGPPVSQEVTLEDQFEIEPGVTVLNPVLFCNPVDKNAEGIIDPDTHLTCYDITPYSPLSLLVAVVNQFEYMEFPLVQSLGLCVPSTKLSWASSMCTENGDDPQCLYGDPCTDGTCAISGTSCTYQGDCLVLGEQCCCHGTCL